MNKNIKMIALASVIGASLLSSCKKDDPQETETETGKGTATLVGEISGNRTLDADTTYRLEGFVYVTDGSTLTIPAGTIIKGDKASKATLVIERGGKIMAQGSETNPVVFTSDQPKGQRNYGDWGGIILCGKAKVNVQGGEAKIEGGPRSFYGGTQDDDNSGTLTYCRLEFCGIEYGTDNEINGLTLGGVGSQTNINHIQVSFCGDDSYEWFGGSVNAKYLVAFRGWDDEFDTDNGFSGKLQFVVGIRDKNVADKSKSNGFESDNDANGSDNSPVTSPTFSNVSLFGPVDLEHLPTGGNGEFQAAMHLRRNTRLKVYNSVFAGWNLGLFIDGDKSQASATAGNLAVKNCVFAGMGKNFNSEFEETYFTANNPAALSGVDDLKINSLDLAKPNFLPQSGSPVLSGANFADLTGFEKVDFIGAFGTTDWTSGWCNFDPQNTEY